MTNDLAVVMLTRSQWEIVKLALSVWTEDPSPRISSEAQHLIDVIREQTSQRVLAAVPATSTPKRGRLASTCKHGVLLWERCAECESPAERPSEVTERNDLTSENVQSSPNTESR